VYIGCNICGFNFFGSLCSCILFCLTIDNGITSWDWPLPPSLTVLVLDYDGLTAPPGKMFSAYGGTIENTMIMGTYLAACAEGEAVLQCCRLLLVGFGGIGKSKLCRALRLQDVARTQGTREDWRAFAVDQLESTHGIEATTWKAAAGDLAAEVEMHGLTNFRFNVWDFAGQMEYYEVHHHFVVRERAVYVLPFPLWVEEQIDGKLTEWTVKDEKLRTRVAARIRCWLSFIRSRFARTASEHSSRKPVVVLVGTFGDHLSTDWDPDVLAQAAPLPSKFQEEYEEFVVHDTVFFMDYARRPELIRELLKYGVQQVLSSEEKCPKSYAGVLARLDQCRRQFRGRPGDDASW
jgi:Ras of Complex, Roc, domain of DAPkinase